MTFRTIGLDPAPFHPLFGLGDEELAAKGAVRYLAEPDSGFPDRIELRDARPGESVLLVNFLHQPAESPYRSSHAIFVREGASTAYDATGEVPPALRSRLLSLRAFDAAHMIIHADLVDGQDAERLIERFLDDPSTAYLHAHYAKRGCFAARIERA